MRRLILSLSGFLVLYIFAANFADAAPQKMPLAKRMPYKCHQLKAKKIIEHGDNDFEYHFKGICTVKDANDQYHDVWVKSEARWQGYQHEASERVTVMGAGGGVIELSMKCEDNPWLTYSRCALLNFGNTTEYASLVSTFRVKKEVALIGYPPISRGGVGVEQLLAKLKEKKNVSSAKQRMMALFEDTEDDIEELPVEVIPKNTEQAKDKTNQSPTDDEETGLSLRIQKKPPRTIVTPQYPSSHVSKYTSRQAQANQPQMHTFSTEPQAQIMIDNGDFQSMNEEDENDESSMIMDEEWAPSQEHQTQTEISKNIFYNPTFKGMRLHWCDSRNRGCGQLAANRWCRLRGYQRAEAYILANNVGRTVHVSNGLICRSKTCDGFKSITCGGGNIR